MQNIIYKESLLPNKESQGFIETKFTKMDLKNTNIADWETHTKGIGSKLLFKQGYKVGKGLGKSLQGINSPIEICAKKGRSGIGSSSKSDKKIRKTKSGVQSLEKNKASHSKINDKIEKEKSSFINNNGSNDILQNVSLRLNKNLDITKCKVVDMTTSEQIFSNYHELNKNKLLNKDIITSRKPIKTSFTQSEQNHNLDMIYDRQNNRRVYLSDKMKFLKNDKMGVTEIANPNFLDNSENASNMIREILDSKSEMTLKEIAETFKILQERYYEDYRTSGIIELASNIISSKMKESLVNWDPLQEPNFPLASFKEWKDILEYGQQNVEFESKSFYDQLISNTWLPIVRASIKNWDCRQPDSLINLVKSWLLIIPSWMKDNIFSMIIHQKLVIAVENWNPNSSDLIHNWIDPWLTVMRVEMDTLICPIIRRKLSYAFDAWHPSDSSLRIMFKNCSKILSNCDLNDFLVRFVVPKLQMALSKLIINPHQQNLEQWDWVMNEWQELIPVNVTAATLNKFFFPKWLHVLALWLNHSTNYEQMINWYKAWKGMLSKNLLAELIIKENLNKGLDMMSRTINIPQCVETHVIDRVLYLITLEREQLLTSKIFHPKKEVSTEINSSKLVIGSFKDLVQRKCEQKGILFMPLPNQQYEGKQIYKIGNFKIYFEKDVLFVYCNEKWSPTRLKSLLKKV